MKISSTSRLLDLLKDKQPHHSKELNSIVWWKFADTVSRLRKKWVKIHTEIQWKCAVYTLIECPEEMIWKKNFYKWYTAVKENKIKMEQMKIEMDKQVSDLRKAWFECREIDLWEWVIWYEVRKKRGLLNKLTFGLLWR